MPLWLGNKLTKKIVMNTLSTTTLKTTDVRSRISPDLKMNAGIILQNCGLDLSTGIRLFLQNVVEHQGIPFAIKMPNPETQRAMLEARDMKEGRFSDMKDLINDIQKNSHTEAGKTAPHDGLHKIIPQRLGSPQRVRTVRHERASGMHETRGNRDSVAA